MVGITIVLVVAVFWLAWSNGANDNFKGVATLYGSNTMGFRRALVWATGATLLGSACSVFLAERLVKQFSGSGIVPIGQIDATWLIAVGGAGAITIFLATVLGMPTSTTHALTGALLGAGIMAGTGTVNWIAAASTFAKPLLLSPVVAVVAAVVLQLLFRRARLALGVDRQTCVCIGRGEPQPVTCQADGSLVLASSVQSAPLRIDVDQHIRCVERYGGRIAGVKVQSGVDAVHYLSGGAVCFARAVNDTPKIAALLLAAGWITGSLPPAGWLALLAGAMALGGWVQSRKVAETMSRKITALNPGQGLTANLVTSGLVLVASHLGMPVSTTHVSCGSIFGIGLVSRQTRWKTVSQIAVTWLTTLPLGAVLGAGLYWAVRTAAN